jgi:hypothetical protein
MFGSSASLSFANITNANLAKFVTNAANFVIGTQGASPIIFAINATTTTGEVARFRASGNLLLGRTSDLGYKLAITGDAHILGKLSVNTPTAASAIMEVTSTTQGFLPPRMTTTEKNAIVTPAAGLQVYDATLNLPSYYNGTVWVNPGSGSGTVTSVGLSMPVAFNVANSPITSSGTLAVTAIGTAAQYIRGDGQLATLPSSASGGSAVSYYLNGSVAASVGTYYQMSKIAVLGAGTDFALAGNGLISQFLTDVADPNRLEIPAGNWNFEMFFSASSSGGTPAFYVELLKYDGTTFTSIASSSAIPEAITSGTLIDLYLTSLAIPQTTLLSTDRLAIRVYIVNSTGGRTITMHTENSHLCEIITNFAGGIAALNGLTANTQYLATGTSGTDFAISSLTDTHTFNLPTASATNRGALSSADWITFNGKASGNIYTDNGTLSGNRTVTMASNYINFSGGNVGIGAAAATASLQVAVANQWSGAFIGNMGTARTPAATYGIHLGFNYTGGSGESNILWGTAPGGVSPLPYLVFSTWDGTTKTDRVEFQDTGNVVFKNYLSTASFPGTAVGHLAFDLSGNVITVPVPSSLNIYNSNGVLTGDRTVGTTTGFKLTFNPNVEVITTTYNPTAGMQGWSSVSGYVQTTIPASTSFSATGYGFSSLIGNNYMTYAGSATFAADTFTGGILGINNFAFTAAASTITITQAAGPSIRTYSGGLYQNTISGSVNGTITHLSGLAVRPIYRTSGTSTITVTNNYGLLINDQNSYTHAAITNRWGVYQEGADDNNYFRAKVIIGDDSTVGASPLNVKNLPTSSAGLSTGDIWNNGGVLNIV